MSGWPGARGSTLVLIALMAILSVVRPVSGQSRTAWQVQGVGTVGATWFYGLGAGLNVWPARRLAITGLASAGSTEPGRAAVRGELLATIWSNPTATTGISLYGGGGIAALGTSDYTHPIVVMLMGAQQAPGAGAGWFLEAGVGGGLRLALGYRLGRKRGR